MRPEADIIVTLLTLVVGQNMLCANQIKFALYVSEVHTRSTRIQPHHCTIDLKIYL